MAQKSGALPIPPFAEPAPLAGVEEAKPTDLALPPHAQVLAQFESLGDNCEFGFVQAHYDVHPLGLLRWSGAPLNGLIRALHARFADLVRFEDVVITNSGMVLDRKYWLTFHAGTFAADDSAGPRPIEQTAAALEVYEKGARHIAALLRMTLDRLAARSRVWLYKTREGMTVADIMRLKQALDLYGEQRLLCVVEACTLVAAGQVRALAPGVKIGGIARFADYARAGEADFPAWLGLCQAALETNWDYEVPSFERTERGLLVRDGALAQALLTALYETLLLRPPDAAGLAGYQQHLASGAIAFEELIEVFLRSREFANRQATFQQKYLKAE